jgi:hypothetical protein
MNLPIKLAIVAISLCSSSVALAEARLQVEFAPAKRGLSETSFVLNLVNVGDQGAVVDKSSIPTVNGRGMLLDDPLIVKQQDGREAEFFGIMRDVLLEAPSFLSIPAGGTFSLSIDLTKGYRLSPGVSYKVGLRAPISYRSGGRTDGAAGSLQQRVGKWMSAYPSARTIVVPVTGETIGKALVDEILGPVACTDPEGTPAAEQKSAVFQSVLAGVTNGAGIALSQLQQMTQFDTSSAPEFWFRFSPSVHYTRYFGEHGPDVNISTGGVVNEDDALVDSTLLAILWRISGDGVTAKPPVSLSCRCNANEAPAGTIAYVQSGAPYVIHTCPVFWSLPMLPANHIAESSKLGTMVHEFTHFTDSKGLALRHPPVEGKNVASLSYAMELAVESHSGAVRFPNAYKFFVLGQVHGLAPQE